MLHWFKYFPLAFRFNNKPNEVNGPYFKKFKKRVWKLSSSQFSFSLPRTNVIFGAERFSRSLDNMSDDQVNLLSENILFSKAFDNSKPDRWESHYFFRRRWFFSGPWFSWSIGSFGLSTSLIRSSREGLFSDVSFFHPRVFESAIADYLNVRYGCDKKRKTSDYRGPMNWTVLNVSDHVEAVSCDIHFIRNTGRDNPDISRIIFMPVSDDHILLFYLDLGLKLNSEYVCKEPILKLAGDIVNSFRLELKGTELEMWSKVKKTCPDMSLTKEFGELKWPIKPEDLGKPQPLPPEAKAFDKIDILPE